MAKIRVKQSKKELWIWRIAFISAVAFFIMKKDPNEKPEIKEECIVKTQLNGLIVYDDEVLNNIYYLAENDKVKGVLLQINSYGGYTIAGEALYKGFNVIKSKKPLVVSAQNMDSAAYMAGMGASKIYAYETSSIGSIGVSTGDMLDVSGLAEKFGVKFFRYKSSHLKALPDEYQVFGAPINQQPTEEGAKSIQKLIDETQVIFQDMVAESRAGIKDISAVVTGEVFTGRKALELGLIDALGTDRQALQDLQKNFNLKTDLPVIDYNIIPDREENHGFFSKAISFAKLFIK